MKQRSDSLTAFLGVVAVCNAALAIGWTFGFLIAVWASQFDCESQEFRDADKGTVVTPEIIRSRIFFTMMWAAGTACGRVAITASVYFLFKWKKIAYWAFAGSVGFVSAVNVLGSVTFFVTPITVDPIELLWCSFDVISLIIVTLLLVHTTPAAWPQLE